MKQPVVPILSVGSLAFYSAATNPTSSALSLQDVNSSRRDLFRKIPAAFTGAVTIGVVTHSQGCLCSSCNGASDSFDSFVAFAYERRDVGGDSPSPEMAAMNLQAYQTMNRLERDGVKLETAEEQRASLTAALSDYSYQPTTTSNKASELKRKKSEIIRK